MKLRSLILLAGLVTLTGCATLNEQECRTANWRDLGIKDGRNGANPPAGSRPIERPAPAMASYSMNNNTWTAAKKDYRNIAGLTTPFGAG